MEIKIVKLLKQDSFGRIELIEREGELCVRRVACGGKIPGSGILARHFARKEQRVLLMLEGVDGVPRGLGQFGRTEFFRSYVKGRQLNQGEKMGPAFFEHLLALIEQVHERGVTHNDLAKEANILVSDGGRPALVDFQLSLRFRKKSGFLRGPIFRMLCREDRRHVLKQKSRYCPGFMSTEEWEAVRRKSWVATVWSMTGMKLYHTITRPLGWRDHEGRGRKERNVV